MQSIWESLLHPLCFIISATDCLHAKFRFLIFQGWSLYCSPKFSSVILSKFGTQVFRNSFSQSLHPKPSYIVRLPIYTSSYIHHNKPNSGIIPRAEGERVACNPNSYREFSSVMNSSAARGPISIFLLFPCTFMSHAVANPIFISFCCLLLQYSPTPKNCAPYVQHCSAWSTCFRTTLRHTSAPYRTHSLQETHILYLHRELSVIDSTPISPYQNSKIPINLGSTQSVIFDYPRSAFVI